MQEAAFVVIGGGIAGVSCVEGFSVCAPNETIILITSSSLIKTITNFVPLTKMLAQFNIEEVSSEKLTSTYSNVTVLKDTVVSIDSVNHTVHTRSRKNIKYKKLCICSGAVPKLILSESEFVIGIRDTDSVKEFQRRIHNARRIVIVGNGGIATEIVHELVNVEIIWAIKDKHISAAFVDPGAAQFFQHRLLKADVPEKPTVIKRMKYTVSEDESKISSGAALGPDWHANFDLKGSLVGTSDVKVEYTCEVVSVLSPDEVDEDVKDNDKNWPVYVTLTNGRTYGCDFIVSATGVVPNVNYEMKCGKQFELASDGGIKVDLYMQTSVEDIYAAGDVCTASWEIAEHWFQMRLWTQARQMGLYAAKAMAASLYKEPILQDFCFELFTHVTTFFGYKVVLLGLFNGQKLNNDYELLLRVTPQAEYIKLVMKNGRMQGAVLIGETDLEEMCENLILNQLDLTPFGEDLLNPNIDIEDYFD